MGHKVLKGGTAYDVVGGTVLKAGTSYSVKNGKVLVGGTEYDISFLLPASARNIWGTGSSYNQEINCICHANGYWVVGGYYRSGSTHYARIAYATSLDGTWTAINIWSVSSYDYNYINCIAYANGYWVVGGRYTASTKYSARIAYAASLSGTWTTSDLSSNNSGACSVQSIKYLNGYWVAGGYYYTGSVRYATVWYINSTSPAGDWQGNTIWNGNYWYEINDFTYANGYWVVAGLWAGSSTYTASISYCTNITSSQSHWTRVSLWNGSYSSNTINCIEYANGYFVVGGSKQTASSSYQGMMAYVETYPSNSWTTVSLLSGSNGYIGITSVAYGDDGYWMVCGKFTGYTDDATSYSAFVGYTKSLGSITNVLVYTNTNSTTKFNDVTYADGYWVVGGTYNYYANICYAKSPSSFAST